MKTVMNGVTEYAEGREVELASSNGRLIIRAFNEGGHNCTEVDLEQLLLWIKTNRPDLTPNGLT